MSNADALKALLTTLEALELEFLAQTNGDPDDPLYTAAEKVHHIVADALLALGERQETAEPPEELEEMKLSLHRCKVCGARWLLWPDEIHGGGWNLLDRYQRPGSCCDNVAMGEQIEHLRDVELVSAQPTPPVEAMADLDQMRQILAADMTLTPSSVQLPVPSEPLRPVASSLYAAIQELRALRLAAHREGPATADNWEFEARKTLDHLVAAVERDFIPMFRRLVKKWQKTQSAASRTERT